MDILVDEVLTVRSCFRLYGKLFASCKLADFKLQRWFLMELHQIADSKGFMNLQTEKKKSPHGVVYCIYNGFDKTRKIYLFCYVPHLLKTIRNSFENSHGHNDTRNLMVSEPISFVDMCKG